MLQFYTWILWCICHGFSWGLGKIHRPFREQSYHGTRGMVLLNIITFVQVGWEKKGWAASCQKGGSCSQSVTRSVLESLLFPLLSNLRHRVNRNFICSAGDPKLLRTVKTKAVWGRVQKHLAVPNHLMIKWQMNLNSISK